MSAEQRIRDLGLTVPDALTPFAAYVPYLVVDRTVYLSGQVPFVNGALTHSGLVGRDVSLDDAVADARVCGINVLAQLRAAAGGSLDRVERILKLTVFVASSEGFHAQPQVANGASELMIEVFGDAGRHARSAVGVSALPLHSTVEVEAIALLRA